MAMTLHRVESCMDGYDLTQVWKLYRWLWPYTGLKVVWMAMTLHRVESCMDGYDLTQVWKLYRWLWPYTGLKVV